MTSSSPRPEDLAQHAVQAASVAFDAVRTFSGDNDADEVHEAWVVIHNEMRRSAGEPSDTATWIQQAAMMLLVGVGSEARAASVDNEEEEVDPAANQIVLAWTALDGGRLDEAAALAGGALERGAADGRAAGNVTHYGNLILGHVCLRRGDEAGAERHLLAAGDTTGSPVLVSFGPNMALARELLERGRTDVVLAYFEKCARFWGSLPEWTAAVRAGRKPDFGANLIYGIPKAAQDFVEASGTVVGDDDDGLLPEEGDGDEGEDHH